MSAILKANSRSNLQKSSLHKLRSEGRIPAIVYGNKMGNKTVHIDSIEFIKTIREVGKNGIISLDLEGEKTDVMLGEYQQDSIKGEILHADFLAVDMGAERTVTVGLALVGEAAGVKDGGVMQQAVHELSITARPADIPQSIELDVTNLQVNENLTVADLGKAGNYTVNDEESLVLVTILPPKQEEEINSGGQQESEPPENEEGRETEPSEG